MRLFNFYFLGSKSLLQNKDRTNYDSGIHLKIRTKFGTLNEIPYNYQIRKRSFIIGIELILLRHLLTCLSDFDM